MQEPEEAAMSWEDSKENFVPLKTGRKPDALSPRPDALDPVEETRQKFWAEVSSSDGTADPLEKWLRFIKWTQETTCNHGHKAELQRVLESCTKAIGTSERYRDDIRYLRVWIQYADCLPDPSDIFLHLRDASVGQGFALFYEAYATFLELKGNFPRADLVYDEGVKRGAKPLERLKQKHAAFQQRMACRMQRQALEGALEGQGAGGGWAAAAPVPRSALAGLAAPEGAARGGGRPHRGARGGAVAGVQGPHAPVSSLGRAAGAPGTAASTLPRLAATGAQRRPGPLEVHEDEEFGAGGAGVPLAAFPPALGHLGALPRYAAGRKENDARPGAWAGARLARSGGGAAVAPAARLEVYEDEDCENGGQEQQPPQPPKPGLRQALDAPAPAPLLGHSAAQTLPTPLPLPQRGALGGSSAPQPQTVQQTRLAGPSGSAGAAAAADKGAARRGSAAAAAPRGAGGAEGAGGAHRAAGAQGFDASLLVGPNGEELCFEEVRAAAWLARTQAAAASRAESPLSPAPRTAAAAAPAHAPASTSAAAGGGGAELAARDAPPPLRRCAAAPATAPLPSVAAAAPSPAARPPQPPPASPPAPPPLAAATHRHVPSASPPPPPPPLPPPVPAASASYDPTLTLSMRAALDAMNAMFSDDLPTGGLPLGGGGGGCGGGGAYADPTVTVNTRAAMDAVARMFGGSGGGDTTTLRLDSFRARKPSAAEINARRGRTGIQPLTGVLDDATGHGHGFGGRGGGGGGDAARSGAGTRGSAGVGGGAGPAPCVGRLELYEDTEFVGEALAAAAGAASGGGGRDGGGDDGATGGGFGLYEDTEFITRPVAAVPRPPQQQQQKQGGATEAAAGLRGGGGGGVAACAGGGFALYEDTEFIAPRPGGRGARRSDGVDSDADAGGGGFALYEDTEFVTAPRAGAALPSYAARPPPRGGASWTEGAAGAPAAAEPAGGEGARSMYEDTEFLTENVGGAAAAAAAAQRAGRGARTPAPPAGAAAPFCESTTALLRAHKENLPAHVAPGPRSGGAGSSGRGAPPPTTGAASPAAAPVAPRAPGTPVAIHADSFTVMDSPAARALRGGAAGAARAHLPSPARSPDASGPKENGEGAAAARHAGRFAPRSLGDPAARARALHPLTPVRSALLGVQLDDAPLSGDGGGGGGGAAASADEERRRGPRALRSLFQQRPGEG